MKISIFGLGYVGSVTAACLAELGHEVLGVDIMPQKVIGLQKGIAPVKEPLLEDLLAKNLRSNLLNFTMDSLEACHQTDCAMIAVGTPSNEQGAVDLKAIERCIESIATSLLTSNKSAYTIIIRSTVPPGTTRKMKALVQRIVQDKCEVSICMNPEFLREGAAVDDFFHPAHIIFGIDAPYTKSLLEKVYRGLDAPVVWIDSATAELVKYTNNAFHGLKVAFANEISRIAEAYQSDGTLIMDLLCADTKLNISKKYLRPGFAFGGSCIPKDLRGLHNIAESKSVATPLISAILPSNDAHITKLTKQVLQKAPKQLSVLGITFKSGTDDLRESASLRLIQALLSEGVEVKMFDYNIDPAKLIGTNRQYIDQMIPNWQNHFAQTEKELFLFSDTIIITTNDPLYKKWIKLYGADKNILDLSEVKAAARPTTMTDQNTTQSPVQR